MALVTGVGTTLESLDEAVSNGRAHGATSREIRLPADIFEAALKDMLDEWKGSDPAWLSAAESAARAAYLGSPLQGQPLLPQHAAGAGGEG
jgi:hypothetical protein